MRIVRFAQLGEQYGIGWCRMQIDREERAGRFPRRVRIGRNTVGWVADEIEEWLAQRAAEREIARDDAA